MELAAEEIILHQDFFEKCAIEYGRLGEVLVNQFMIKYKIDSLDGFPLKKFIPFLSGKTYKQSGKMGEWNYFIHGYHCRFSNRNTKQNIEVPLNFGEEFGVLDPYFFIQFILSTQIFHPLPFLITNEFSDGVKVLDTMIKIGKFEEINSNIEGVNGVIVKKRNPKEVKIYQQKFILNSLFKLKMPD